jgi:hypothetical protein
MKNFTIGIGMAIFMLSTSYVVAQVPVDYLWAKLKCELPPLAPLPADKTYNLQLPEGLTYLPSKDHVRDYWSPYGLILINKWDTKNPAHYTFKFVMAGMKVNKTNVIEKESNVTISGKEFFREYTFTFPAKIEVMDNETGNVIREIEIVNEQEEFTRNYHRNIFITDTFSPSYKKELGFDSLKQVIRAGEFNSKVMQKLEGEFASETFEKVKSALVHLFGKSDMRADFCVLNPKAKGRTQDFSTYDAAAQKMKAAIEKYNSNPSDPSLTSTFEELDTFYETASKDAAALTDYLPFMVYWNLTEINLIKGDMASADVYYQKMEKAQKPGNSYIAIIKSAYDKTNVFYGQRSTLNK